ncbi:MAG: TIGR01244 family phosphatase [Litoreibacter sp.]|nr:TIGR01244 family phosphatase [Litoreibacter sp.]
MEPKKLSEEFSACAQLSTDEMPMVHALGYKTVLCNRPDGEEISQQLFEAIETAAKNAGLTVHYLPVVSGGPTAEEIEAFRNAYDSLPKPILAYCRSGGRSTKLYEAMKQMESDAG